MHPATWIQQHRPPLRLSKPWALSREPTGRPVAAPLARASALHPWRVLGLWFVMIAVGAVLASGLSNALTNEATFTSEPESVKADRLLEERLRGPRPVSDSVIITSDQLTVDADAFRAVIERTTAELRALDGVVTATANPYEQQNAGLISEDRHTALIPVTFAGDFDDASSHAAAFLETVERQQAEGFTVLTIGDVSIDETFGTMAEEDLRTGETIGAGVALIVLIIVFGALVAAGLPLLLGAVAIVVAMGLTALVGKIVDLSIITTNVITMIGLAVGIDYSLFIVERYREERRHGLSMLDAIELTGSTATRAVIFSAMTVVLALLGMFVVPFSIFRSIGAGAILVVIVAVLGATTLIPALLGLAGDRIDWPHRRRYDEVIVRGTAPAGETHRRGFWARVARAVMARPIISAGLAAVLLLGAAAPYFDLERGWAGVDALPESDVLTAYRILERDFSAGQLDPFELVVTGQPGDPTVAANADALAATLAADPTFVRVLPPQLSAEGDLALVTAYPAVDGNSDEAYAALERLRQDTIPKVVGTSGAQVYVTGATAMNQDFFDAVDDATPFVFAFVLTLSFVLLTLVFRSIVVPLKAIVMNLLSVGAAYGLLVLVFQKGYGAALFGFTTTPVIAAYLPIFLFCFLFGLSMDYHVFLLSRIREHHELTGNNREAVAVGLQATAKIITGAALIMVAVFGGFAAGRLVELQQLGFGLAVAVLVDATLVRTVLVPATMALLGEWNWYFPRWLRRLPDLGEAHRASRPANWP
jgi:RND superfamily putative drug exporter